MITRRQLVGRAVMLTSALALSACAPSAPSAAPTPAGGSSGAPATTAPGAAGAATPGSTGSGGSYKLDLGGYQGPAPTSQAGPAASSPARAIPPPVEQWWKDIYAEWASAYPNITVQEETVPYGDLQQKLQTYVAAGDVPGPDDGSRRLRPVVCLQLAGDGPVAIPERRLHRRHAPRR